MALVIPPQFAKVAHLLQLSGDPDPYVVTYGVAIEAGATPTPNALAAALFTPFQNKVMQYCPSLLSHLGVDVEMGAAAGAPHPIGTYRNPTPGVGTSTNILPQNVALLIHKRTAEAGRTGRGRLYIPALEEAAASHTGALSGSSLSAYQTAYNEWLAAIVALPSVASMVLLHDSGGAGAALPPYDVTSLTVDPVVATQRRRLRR